MFRYQFTSTIKDLLDAQEAEAVERTGLRRSLRWAIAAIAAMGVMGAGASALEAKTITGIASSILGVIITLSVIYYYVGAGILTRRRIRAHNDPSADVIAEFSDDAIHLEVSGFRTYTRDWSEFGGLIDGAKGVVIYFGDGTVNWLPNRVFSDKAERGELLDFLRKQLADSSFERE